MSFPRSPKTFERPKYQPPKSGGSKSRFTPPQFPDDNNPLQRPAVIVGLVGLGIVMIVCLGTVLALGPERICGSFLLLLGSLLFGVNWIQRWLPEGCVPGCVRGVLLLAFLTGLALVVGGDKTVNLVGDLNNFIQ